MKDNISIIFAAIIGTFLVVILPLVSILDRQDSMSYNVVLNETTKFVDDVRNNGFLHKDSYNNYIAALASTSNTYKVTIEAYRKVLIPETDENGNTVEHSFVEAVELYNTKDILEVLDGISDDVDASNQKENVYLFDENDEIYVKVYNTNITSGSILYTALAGPVDNKVIDISYGGVVNNVNWELYNKIEEQDNIINPEVIMSVPTNRDNNTNIIEINSDGTIGDIDCTRYDELSFEEQEICSDTSLDKGYSYRYDLTKEANRTIKIAVELKGFESIDTGNGYKSLSEVKNNFTEPIENYIKSNYIQLNGMYADINLTLWEENDYYFFGITLTDVRMSILGFTSSLASITILPGLGYDQNEVMSLGADSVELELTDAEAIDRVTITGPYNFPKLKATKSWENSLISDNIVYKGQEIVFVVSYTGLGSNSSEIINEIKDKIIIKDTEYTDLSVTSLSTFCAEKKIPSPTTDSGHVVIKFKYNKENDRMNNYIELPRGWFTIKNDEQSYGAAGSASSEYRILVDDLGPYEPYIRIKSGTLGNLVDGVQWYTSNIEVDLVAPTNDRRYEGTGDEAYPITGGVGVEGVSEYSGLTYYLARRTYGTSSQGKLNISVTASDYLGNKTTTSITNIGIDITAPRNTKIGVKGTKGKYVDGKQWYLSDINVTITPGEETNKNASGIANTTYEVTSNNKTVIPETVGTEFALTNEGMYTIIARTYDKAGNVEEVTTSVGVEKTLPKDATIEVIKGTKNSEDNDWFIGDVTIKITLDNNTCISGLALGNSYNDVDSYYVLHDPGSSNASYDDSTKTDYFNGEFIKEYTDLKTRGDNEYRFVVHTITKAGNKKVNEFTVKIDTNPPLEPDIEVDGYTHTWNKSDVTIKVSSNGDRKSGVKDITYKITKDDVVVEEKKLDSGDSIKITEDGTYKINICVRDNALNKIEKQLDIKVDKTPPTSGEIIVEGTQGENGWYISDVTISHTNGKDATSGIKTEDISHTKITQNTRETVITLKAKDYAGNVTTVTKTIKIDKYRPSQPQISIQESAAAIENGVRYYNKDINVKITPGTKSVYSGNNYVSSGVAKTTYEVTQNGGQTKIIPETEGTEFTLNKEGNYTITARTYDNAGNVNEASQAVSINKQKPNSPIVISIDGTNVENEDTKNITGDRSFVLTLGNIGVGNKVTIVLLNEKTYQVKTQTIDSATANTLNQTITLSSRGTYQIKVTQTNIYGTTSDESLGYYTYTYE